MKLFKCIIALVIFILNTTFSIAQNKNLDDSEILNGLYFGQQGGFPSTTQIVFIEKEDNILKAECYFPFKGSVFIILLDTLYQIESKPFYFKGTKSILFEDHGNLFFKTDSLLFGYKFNDVEIEYDPERIDKLIDFRNRAVPWSSR